ncbi:MAG TPA: hypothetical protein VNZ85_19730 [Caulobacter sp.]|nr:hypothetical protein [Caulobacter sp.]
MVVAVIATRRGARPAGQQTCQSRPTTEHGEGLQEATAIECRIDLTHDSPLAMALGEGLTGRDAISTGPTRRAFTPLTGWAKIHRLSKRSAAICAASSCLDRLARPGDRNRFPFCSTGASDGVTWRIADTSG